MNPPDPPCVVQRAERDEFTGKYRMILEAIPFFSYTPEELKGQLQHRPFIDGKVALSRISNTLYLLLKIDVATTNTSSLFGKLPEEGLLKIKLLSGETVNMVAARSSKDVYSEDNRTVFTAYYPVRRSIREALAANPVDRLRVVWDTGYEDYEVYHLEAVQHLLKCMDKKK